MGCQLRYWPAIPSQAALLGKSKGITEAMTMIELK